MDPIIARAQENDLPAILELQKLAFQSEALIYGACAVSPLSQTMESIKNEYRSKTFLTMTLNGRLVGSIRASETAGVCCLEKLVVHPIVQDRGFGGQLIDAAERVFSSAKKYELMTGQKSEKNIHLYTKHGYRIVREEAASGGTVMVWMEKAGE
ncbi:MAG: GNAT family N-acetyltransferase [Candidatus Omnitrophota bacterium]